MTLIRRLPQSEVDKICAGEVVERPASIVKELVENAIDAASTRVEIAVEEGGRSLISVLDDGCGIPADELELALAPHCTSKIRRASDLYEKQTLGFRGEALYSIAAVSKLVIASRRPDASAGTELSSEPGSVVDRRRLAMSPGTRVDVRELFLNTPVRRKFLKSKSSEVSFVASLILDYALCYPEIAWKLVSDGKELFATQGDGDLHPLLRKAFDNPEDDDCVSLLYEASPNLASGQDLESASCSYRLGGVALRPHRHKATRASQHFFVNRRPVRNRMLFRAVDDAYREYISSGKHPQCVILLDIPPSDIDVNIHPSKYEVNFSNSQFVYMLITRGVRQALADDASHRKMKLATDLACAVPPPIDRFDTETPDVAETVEDYLDGGDAAETRLLMRKSQNPSIPLPTDLRSIPLYVQTDSQEGGPAGKREPLDRNAVRDGDRDGDADSLKILDVQGAIIGQIDKTYIAVVRQDAVYLIDQHSAHERIIFEQVYANLNNDGRSVERQSLVFPILLSVRQDQLKALKKYVPYMNKLGFDAEVFGEDTLLLREVPAAVADRMDSTVLKAIVEEFLQTDHERSYSELVKNFAATTACKCAIKAGDVLAQSEMTWLVQALVSIRDASTCPHGRPTAIRLGASEIGRFFQRK